MEDRIKLEIWFKKEHEKIAKIYKKIYILVFRFALPFILIISSLFITNNAINRNNLQNISIFPDIDKTNLLQEDLIQKFNKINDQKIDNKQIEIEILQWDLYTKSNQIYSIDNLVKYQWYIIPKSFVIDENIILSAVEYFDSDSYSIDKLESVIKNIVFSTKLDTNNQNNKQMVLDENIENTFNISCIFENKITQKMCDYYTDQFLKSFFVYDIKNDISWLNRINEKLSQTDKHKNFCEWIKKIILYSKSTEYDLKDIVQTCWSWISIQEFQKINNFILVQKELNDWYIKDQIYEQEDINIYKLLSFQQIIFNDIKSQRINNVRINSYINFLKNLLKNNNLSQFYKEEIYRFNNYFLIKNLESIPSSDSNVIKDLYSINKWNSLFWIIWLSSQIKNKNLENYNNPSTNQNNQTWWNLSWNQNLTIETLLQWLYNLSFLTITKNEILDNKKIQLQWHFQISNQNIKTNMTFEQYLNTLIVKKIYLSKYEWFSIIINSLIETQNRWINKLYQYILENIDNYWAIEDISINDIWLCDILKIRSNYKILECSEQTITIEKNWIKYEFNIEDQKISDFIISDPDIQNYVKDNLAELSQNSFWLAENIREILDFTITESSLTWNQNSILITEIFQKHLWIKPKDVIQWEKSFFLSFELKDINFIAEFDLASKTIQALYFQDIRQDTRPLNIKNFYLKLDDNNKTQINQFLINPIIYIKNLDSFAYINYENQFIKQSEK